VKATLADLLRVSGASVANQAVFLDGAPPEEAVPLDSGMVVTIVPLRHPASSEGALCLDCGALGRPGRTAALNRRATQPAKRASSS
jgi:hypothetical protein